MAGIYAFPPSYTLQTVLPLRPEPWPVGFLRQVGVGVADERVPTGVQPKQVVHEREPEELGNGCTGSQCMSLSPGALGVVFVHE